MLVVDIALGVAGGVLLVFAGAKILELPEKIAAHRQKERHHREFIESMIEVANRAEAAAKEAMAKKPRRKPAVKKPAPKKAPVKKQPVTPKKGASNVKTRR